MAAPNFYSYYALPGDHHMKPSERFARPDGPVFMVDEEKKQKNRVHQGPTFTYTFKEEQSHGHHSNSSTSTTYSPVSDNAGHGGENTTDTPSTSIEEVTSASDNQHVPLPQLPPKHPSRFLQNTHATRIELPELQTSFENEQDQEHQESRDQLSPLLASSPRKLDLRNHSSSNNTVTSQKSTTSSTTLSDRGREQQEEPTKSPPNQRRSFLTTFGIKNANQQSVISNNTTKSSGYGTRRRGNSADDSIVAEYKHLDTRSSSGSIHSSNEITRPEERESASFEDHPKSEAGPNETQEKRSSRSVAKGLVSNLGRRSKSANRIPIESTPVTQSHAAPASGQVGNDVKGVTTHSKWKAYRSRQARPTGMVAALQDDWVELPSISHVDNEHIHAQPGDLERNNPRGFDVTEHPGHYPMNLKQYSTTTPKPEGTPESSKANRQFLPKTPSPVKLSLKTLPSNWKNNKSSISTGSSDSHRVFGDNIAPQTSISTVSPSLPLEPSREHVRSPPFYMRGVFVNQKKKDYIPERGVSSQSSSSPNGRGMSVLFQVDKSS